MRGGPRGERQPPGRWKSWGRTACGDEGGAEDATRRVRPCPPLGRAGLWTAAGHELWALVETQLQMKPRSSGENTPHPPSPSPPTPGIPPVVSPARSRRAREPGRGRQPPGQGAGGGRGEAEPARGQPVQAERSHQERPTKSRFVLKTSPVSLESGVTRNKDTHIPQSLVKAVLTVSSGEHVTEDVCWDTDFTKGVPGTQVPLTCRRQLCSEARKGPGAT